MWQRFTERARKVVFYAQEEAGSDGQTQVGTEHLLAGLLREQDSVANRLLAKLNVQLESIQAELSQRRIRSDAQPGCEMQLADRSKRVIDLAYDEARQLGNNYIGTEHLLLGLLREDRGLAGQILGGLGLGLQALRSAVSELQSSKPTDKPTGKSPPNQSPEIDDVDLIDLAAQEPVIRIANSIIQQAVREGASDIHVERKAPGIRILYRIDGVFSEMMTVPSHVGDDLVARFKTMAEIDTARHGIPLQGTIHLRLEGTPYDLRVSLVPIRSGEKLVIRIPQEFPIGLAKLGLLEDDLTTVRAWIARRSGLILVFGSTGAGKTTTSFNLLREIIDSEGSVVAIQNQFESEFPGVTTFIVDTKSGMTVETTLESALLGAPDVISIGSVLSHPSEPLLRLVLDAALSGPLILLKYHAPSAAGAVNRILSAGIPMRLMNDILIGIVGQSLVRRVCENCKRPTDQVLSPQIREQSRLAGYDPPTDAVLYEGAGCDFCRDTGHKGRIGLFELLPWSKDVAEATQRQASAEDVTALAATHDIKTRFADGIRKALMGLTTIKEVERVVGFRG